MATETVYIGKEPVTIKLAPITLMFNAGYKNTFYPDRVMIDADMTIAHFRQLAEISPFVAAFFKMVVPDYPYEINVANLREAVPGFQHLAGLLDLSLRFILQRRKFGWRYPETYLHPKYQANLADVMITLSSPEKFVGVITDVKKKLLEDKNAGDTDSKKME